MEYYVRCEQLRVNKQAYEQIIPCELQINDVVYMYDEYKDKNYEVVVIKRQFNAVGGYWMFYCALANSVKF